MTELQKMLNTTETFMYGEFKAKVAHCQVYAVEYPTDVHELQFEDLDGDLLYECMEEVIREKYNSLFRVLEIKDGWYIIAAIVRTDDPNVWTYYASASSANCWLEYEPVFDDILFSM